MFEGYWSVPRGSHECCKRPWNANGRKEVGVRKNEVGEGVYVQDGYFGARGEEDGDAGYHKCLMLGEKEDDGSGNIIWAVAGAALAAVVQPCGKNM